MDELARDRARWKGEIVLSWRDIGIAALGIISLAALAIMGMVMLKLGQHLPPLPPGY